MARFQRFTATIILGTLTIALFAPTFQLLALAIACRTPTFQVFAPEFHLDASPKSRDRIIFIGHSQTGGQQRYI